MSLLDTISSSLLDTNYQLYLSSVTALQNALDNATTFTTDTDGNMSAESVSSFTEFETALGDFTSLGLTEPDESITDVNKITQTTRNTMDGNINQMKSAKNPNNLNDSDMMYTKSSFGLFLLFIIMIFLISIIQNITPI